MVRLAGRCWPTPQALGRAIRDGLWWPMPNGYKHYPEDAPHSIPPTLRAKLPA
jgi:hypothetical protein